MTRRHPRLAQPVVRGGGRVHDRRRIRRIARRDHLERDGRRRARRHRPEHRLPFGHRLPALRELELEVHAAQGGVAGRGERDTHQRTRARPHRRGRVDAHLPSGRGRRHVERPMQRQVSKRRRVPDRHRVLAGALGPAVRPPPGHVLRREREADRRRRAGREAHPLDLRFDAFS